LPLGFLPVKFVTVNKKHADYFPWPSPKVLGAHCDMFGWIKIDRCAVTKAFTDKGIELLLPDIGETRENRVSI